MLASKKKLLGESISIQGLNVCNLNLSD
jgi:hypothetical protein